MNELIPTPAPRVRWKQVALFLGLTFLLTWLLDFAIWRTGGLAGNPAVGLALQLQMLLPAFSAIVLGTFVFTDSPIYRSVKLGAPRIFYTFYMLFTIVYAGLAVWAFLSPIETTLYLTGIIATALMLLGLLLVIILRAVGGRQAFSRAGLAGGKLYYWPLFSLALMALYGIQAALGYFFGQGQVINPNAMLVAMSAGNPSALQLAQFQPAVVLAVLGVQMAVIGPIQGLLIAFGEEFGWRGYLQGELTRLGPIPGIALVGLIWGVWHAPVIAMGHNYPGYPVAGVFMMIGYCICLGFLLGYAMLKSGSVWLAALLHALNNQFVSFLITFVYRPADTLFSFYVGVYSLIVPAVIIILLVLLDPVWRRRPAAEAKPAPELA